MKTSQQTDKLFPALFKVKKEMGTVKKGADNPFFKSKYADLNAHLEMIEPLLAEHGLMLLQPGDSAAFTEPPVNVFETVLVHAESGQWISSSMSLVLGKQSMQDAGSAITYARRYTLGSLLGMQAVDDDGEASMGRGKNSAAPHKTAVDTKAAVEEAVKEVQKARSTFKKPGASNGSSPPAEGGWEN